MVQSLPDPAAGRSRGFLIAAALLLAGLTLASWYVVHAGVISFPAIVNFMERHRTAGPIVFVLLHTLAAIAFLPCSPLTALSGVLWDQPYAVLYSMSGAVAGSCATFALARTIAGEVLRKRLRHKAVTWAYAQVEAHGWETVAFTQINPVFPASTLGYVFGLSRIPFRVYLVTSIVFMLPLQLMLVSVGQSFRNALLPGDSRYLFIQLGVMLISGLALLALKPITRKLLAHDRKHA